MNHFQYSFLLLALLVCQVAFVVMVWVYQGQLMVEFDNAFDLVWKQRGTEPAVVDSFQTVVSIDWYIVYVRLSYYEIPFPVQMLRKRWTLGLQECGLP